MTWVKVRHFSRITNAQPKCQNKRTACHVRRCLKFALLTGQDPFAHGKEHSVLRGNPAENGFGAYYEVCCSLVLLLG